MNIFKYYPAHHNPVTRLVDLIEKRNRGESPGLPEHVVIIASRMAASWIEFLSRICSLLEKAISGRPKKKCARAPPPGQDISVIIVNWNGRDMLRTCLTNLYAALEQLSAKHEVIVVDNSSTDGSVEMLRKEFDGVTVIPLTRNTGFGAASNIAARRAVGDLLLFLNNDIRLSRDSLKNLVRHFESEAVFAVAPRAVRPDGSCCEGYSWCELTDSGLTFFNERQFPDTPHVSEPVSTLYALGACALVRRDVFMELGGFGSQYAPFYWEDNDLSYRALKRGYRVVYDPRIEVIHEHGASSRRLSPFYVLAIMEKNTMLFYLGNLTDAQWFAEYVGRLKSMTGDLVRKKDYARLIAIVLAALQCPHALCRRIADKKREFVTDREILETHPAP